MKLPYLSDQDKQINTRVYDEYHTLHMIDGWYGTHKMQNYKQMMQMLARTNHTLEDKSVLDVGCGSGDLSAFVRKLGATTYLGIDMYEPAIQSAKQKYPDETFLLEDFLSVKLTQAYDYAFCSGSLTVKLASDNYAFLTATIAKMLKFTTMGLVFNVLTDDDKDPDKDLFFYNPERVETIGKNIALGGNIILQKHPTRAEMHVFMYQ